MLTQDLYTSSHPWFIISSLSYFL